MINSITRLVFPAFFSLLFTVVSAQKPDSLATKKTPYSSLSKYFDSGEFSFYTRSVSMGTLNQGQLKDDYAIAAGAGMSYRSAPLSGFGFGLGGFFLFNVNSSKLADPDKTTAQANRYEQGLFDVTQPNNKRDLNRLETAYLYYQRESAEVTLGRMNISTPFINPQDGRMRPGFEEGIYLKGQTGGNWTYHAGWFWAISPRSTVSWYKVAESIGTYPVGLNTSGKRSMYVGNLKSAGVALGGVEYRRGGQNIQAWSTFIENISNTLLISLEQEIGEHWIIGGQFTRQDRIKNGGNTDSKYTYMENKESQVYSTRFQYRNKRSTVNLNYSHFTAQGRFLFPREWGREPFYTFIPRERIEGNGNVNAVTINFQQRELANRPVHINLALGFYQLPSPTNYRLNKNGMDDYAHFNTQLFFQPKGKWSGFSASTLLMLKKNLAGQLPDKNLFNRSEMAHIELILNYYFVRR